MESLRIVSLKPHHGPGATTDIRLIVELEPVPPEGERRWWARQVAGGGSVGSSVQQGRFNVQIMVDRAGLEDRVRTICRSLACANADYPGRFEADQAAERVKRERLQAEEAARLDEEQDVIDRVRREEGH